MRLSVKARLVSGHISWLHKEQKLNAVLARVPPATAALARNPPPGSSWVDYENLEPLLCALDAIEPDAVLRMMREQIRTALLPPLVPVLSAVLRNFDTSPAWAFRNFNELSMTSVRGMKFVYHALSNRSGVMEVDYQIDREIPMCTFVSCIAGFEALLELCGANGTVSPPERLSSTRARFHIAW